jgi:hypothetical protein
MRNEEKFQFKKMKIKREKGKMRNEETFQYINQDTFIPQFSSQHQGYVVQLDQSHCFASVAISRDILAYSIVHNSINAHPRDSGGLW